MNKVLAARAVSMKQLIRMGVVEMQQLEDGVVVCLFLADAMLPEFVKVVEDSEQLIFGHLDKGET